MPEPEFLQQQRQILKVQKTAVSERIAREADAMTRKTADQETVDILLSNSCKEAEKQYANASVTLRLRRQSEQGAADTSLEQARQTADIHLARVHQAQKQAQAALAAVGLGVEYEKANVKPPRFKPADIPSDKLERSAVRTRDLAVAVTGLTNDLRTEREKSRNRRRNLEIAAVVGLIVLLSLLLVVFSKWQRRQAIRQDQATATAEIVIAQSTATAMAPVVSRLEADIGMEMVYVPPGDFIMGSPDNLGYEDEDPKHTVRLGPYWIDKTEVTAAQYRRCVIERECSPAGSLDLCTYPYPIEAPLDHPINCVEWKQADDYCRWAGKRLPTEAEWEKAARGVDGRTFPWGEDEPDCGFAQFGNCDGGSVPAGSRPNGASPYGAMDMAGNVGEWVADWYGASYYSVAPTQNPSGPASGDSRVVRGGSWNLSDSFIRVTSRTGISPFTQQSDIGFRCAISP